MNKASKAAGFLCATMLSFALTNAAGAQNPITPLVEPVVEALPPLPSGAKEAYDAASIAQLMKVVELSRIIGGGITQLFQTVINQTAALETIRDAQTGAKTIPFHNGPNDAAARQGGLGLKEMADATLAGAPVGAPGIDAMLSLLRSTYGLEQIFALKDGELPTNRYIAQASAQGGVASASAEESYKRANASMERLGSYIEALENSADLKTSVDLNTRVMIEMNQQLNESLRLQAATASMIGTYFMMMGGEAGRAASLSGK